MNPRAAEIKRLRKKADRLLQGIIRRERPVCEVCGKPTYAGHHFFPVKSSSELRYDFKNIVALCGGCHVRHHRGNNPEIHAKIIRDRGDDWFDDLFSRKATLRNRNKPYYLEQIAALEARLEGCVAA